MVAHVHEGEGDGGARGDALDGEVEPGAVVAAGVSPHPEVNLLDNMRVTWFSWGMVADWRLPDSNLELSLMLPI